MEKTLNDNDHIILIGDKPMMNYVTATVLQFTQKGATELIIKARGKYINRAVDVANVTEERFLNNKVKVETVKIASQQFEHRQTKKPIRISIIEILLKAI